MGYSTIQVTQRMRRRLARYKRPKMSYERILEILLDAVPPAEFQARLAAAERASAEVVAGIGRRDASVAADEARGLEADRLARLTPGQRMEEAYRLFTLWRGPQ